MGVYVIEIKREPIAIFNAASKGQAERRVHEKGGMAEDMLVLETDDRRSFWDGATPIIIREATPFEYNRWQASRNRERESDDPVVSGDEGDEVLHCLWLKSGHDPTE